MQRSLPLESLLSIKIMEQQQAKFSVRYLHDLINTAPNRCGKTKWKTVRLCRTWQHMATARSVHSLGKFRTSILVHASGCNSIYDFLLAAKLLKNPSPLYSVTFDWTLETELPNWIELIKEILSSTLSFSLGHRTSDKQISCLRIFGTSLELNPY